MSKTKKKIIIFFMFLSIFFVFFTRNTVFCENNQTSKQDISQNKTNSLQNQNISTKKEDIKNNNKKSSSNQKKEKKKKVVRVGWFYSEGIHNKDIHGNYTGYDYDFLMAIAQYTDWEFEFVEGNWSTCYELLKNGDIDLMGIVNKTSDREQIFDFAYTSSGTEFCNLYTKNSNQINYEDFKNFNGLTIGVEKNTYQAEELKNFAKDNNFTYKEVIYDNLEKAANALDKGDIDVFLASNTDFITGYDKISQFNAIPFYYAVTKGNTDLLNELNRAINKISLFNPNFSIDLYNKYFLKDLSENIFFTEEEKNFIKKNPQVFIMYDSKWFPLEYFDKKTQSYVGIVPEIIKQIEAVSGLNFEILDAENGVEVLKDFREEQGNKITSISYDFWWAEQNKVKITQPFVNASIVRVSKINSSRQKRVALVELDYITENVKKFYPELEPVYYSNVEECFESIKKDLQIVHL